MYTKKCLNAGGFLSCFRLEITSGTVPVSSSPRLCPSLSATPLTVSYILCLVSQVLYAASYVLRPTCHVLRPTS